MEKWWQNTIVYQVYLRSFLDTNNDGIGDLQGVIAQLDYLQSLEIETIWISPHYDSPMDDNGYDIRNFLRVSEDYGTMDDFRQLLEATRSRGMKVIIDLVLNHTSDEHPWFVAARDPNHPEHERYHDYYIWQPPKYDESGERTLPTRWVSWFGGPVWEYNPPTDSYYLHIFSKKMPDLNWRNKAMREDLKRIIRWWVDLGVDGFRIDASNHLEKNWSFPDARPGYEHFSSLPKHHEYLAELGREIFIPNDLMIMGEAGGASRAEALQYAGFDSEEFNMLIQFEHCWVDCDPTNQLTPGKWAKGVIDLPRLKHSFAHWIDVFKGKGWNTIYWANHDQPRVVSHYGSDDPAYHVRSAKMLAYVLYFLPGTPIVYYGEEIGMTNVDYTKLSDFRDVEVFTEYENFIANGASHDIAMQALRDRARDNARSPMQWNSMLHAGFSEHTPWMPVNNNYEVINVRRQQNDEHSILQTYRKILKLRKKERLAFGAPKFFDLDHPQFFSYRTVGVEHEYWIVANFKESPLLKQVADELEGFDLYLHNIDCDQIIDANRFEPFEARVYRRRMTQNETP